MLQIVKSIFSVLSARYSYLYADMAESEYARDLKSLDRNVIWVQIPLSALP